MKFVVDENIQNKTGLEFEIKDEALLKLPIDGF
jgi:hypothetical protein